MKDKIKTFLQAHPRLLISLSELQAHFSEFNRFDVLFACEDLEEEKFLIINDDLNIFLVSD